jgi:ribosome biogenesis SPOUT family RNA methylase Rps3
VEKIQYIDHPEIRTNANESTEMPFRYVVDKDGEPIMPPVSPQSLQTCSTDSDLQN